MDDDLNKLLRKIKDEKKISLPFLARELSLGFNQVLKVFHVLIARGMIDSKGKINKEKFV